MSPPSGETRPDLDRSSTTALKFFDAFITEKFGTNWKMKVSSDELAEISDLCSVSVLLMPINSVDECSSDGICHIGAGLTIGPRGYGSVFWRGPFELPLPMDTNFDEIVHFRNKEVVVYPDEPTKPEQGEGLNRTAIISLERISPLNSDRQLIKDADELRRLSFRDKLERICQRRGATFRDYQPATVTWEFVVEYFSKYGLKNMDRKKNATDDPDYIGDTKGPSSFSISPEVIIVAVVLIAAFLCLIALFFLWRRRFRTTNFASDPLRTLRNHFRTSNTTAKTPAEDIESQHQHTPNPQNPSDQQHNSNREPAELLIWKSSTEAPPLPPPAPLTGSMVCPPPPPPPPFLFKTQVANDASTKYKKLHWTPIPVKAGTLFAELDAEKLMDKIDLRFLEEHFKSCGAVPGHSSSVSTSEKPSLLDVNRLRNIAIIRHNLGRSVVDIMADVHRFDLSVLTQDQVEILMKIVPTVDEMKRYKEYSAQNNGSYDDLTIEDQFMGQLMKIERRQLQTMSFMAGFTDTVKLIIPQLEKVINASISLREAKKFPKVMEVILAIGNEMNGTRRAPVYGFKMSSLDSLFFLRSTKDRSVSLMYVIAEIVSTTFNELLDFPSELKFVEAAANVNMETLTSDVQDIEKKFEQTCAEQKRHGKDNTPPALGSFIADGRAKVEQLRDVFKLANKSFQECAMYFGEKADHTLPEMFFTKITAFSKNFVNAHKEFEAKQKAKKRHAEEQERKAAVQAQRQNAGNEEKQNRLMDKLNAKFLQSLGGSDDEKRRS